MAASSHRAVLVHDPASTDVTDQTREPSGSTARPDEAPDTDQGVGTPPPAGSTTAPPPPSPPPAPPLRRRTDDKMIAGVASGLAAHLRVDPALVRIGFVVLLFTGGIGIPLYLAGWLLIPEAGVGDATPRPATEQKGPAFWIGVGLLVLVAIAVADEVAFAGRNSWWPLVLVAAGIALWRVGRRDDASTPPPPTPGSPPTPSRPDQPFQETAMSAATTTTRVTEYTPPPVGGGRAPAPATFEPPPPPRREGSYLGRITIALAFIGAGVTVALDRAGIVDAVAADVLAVVLIVLGAGLVVGTWFGRARWLIAIALVLTPVVVVSSVVASRGWPVAAGLGDRAYTVVDAADVPVEGFDLGLGSLSVDLRSFAGSEEPIRIDVGAGEVVVTVPEGADVTLDAEVGAGEIEFLGDESVNGTALERSFTRSGDGPTIRLDVRVGAGSVDIVQVPAPTTDTTASALSQEVHP